MEIVLSVLQLCLDAAALSLCCEAVFRERQAVKKQDLLLFPILFLLCTFERLDFVAGQQINTHFISIGFEIVPADDIFLLLLLIASVLLLSGILLKVQNPRYIFCGTMAVFSIYLLSRFVSILLFTILRATDTVMLLGSRAATIFLIAAFIITPVFHYIRKLLQSGYFLVQLAVFNIVLLFATALVVFSFDVSRLFAHLEVFAVLLLAVLFMDSILLYLNQRNEQERKRVQMMEEYIPIIEELISQVRARQHEFNNRLLAIQAAVESADTLEQVKNDVAALSQGVTFTPNDRELLSCDSKIIAGMLFGKMKQAELEGIQIEVELHGLFKKTTTAETEWIEVIAILLDNAIEAAQKGDAIFLKSRQQGNYLELTVSNPFPAMSNTEFMALFQKGVTTKEDRDTHGFGLYNVLHLVEQRHGKVISRNQEIDSKNHVVFGVLLP